jgi:acyl-CoA thioesterase I
MKLQNIMALMKIKKRLFIMFFASILLSSPLFAKTVYTVVFIGDSLTMGYGVDKERSYPALLEKRFKSISKGREVKFVNGGISGSTTASTFSRYKRYKKVNPDLYILALGANDGLRGIKVEESKKNLEKVIIDVLKSKKKIILVGMKVPPNYGKSYSKSFKEIYTNLANKYKLSFVPFLLEKVAGEKELNQPDGIHPNEKGHVQMAENIYPFLKKEVFPNDK